MDYGLKGKTAVVTGAGGVICGVMSKELAKQGVKVALLDILEENARKVADEITAAGGEAIALKADVLDPKSLEEACSKVVEAFGGVDFLINGAGGNKRQATTSPETTPLSNTIYPLFVRELMLQ